MPNLSLVFSPGEQNFIDHCEQAETKMVLGYLNHPRYVFRRSAAVVLLVRGGEEILSNARCLCSNSDFKLRQMGALIIGEIAIENWQLNDVITQLRHLALTDSSFRVRAEAMRALGLRCEKYPQLYSSVLPVLEANMTSPFVSVRANIACALTRVNDPGAIPILEKLLQDSNLDIRDLTAFAVNMTGLDSKKIRSNLVKMLKEPYYDARCEAITALAIRRDKRVLPALIKELTGEEVRDSMIQAAADICEAELIPILESLLDKYGDDDGLIQDSIDQLKKDSKT